MSKYKAVRTNGFASKKEAKRAEELRLLAKAEAIIELSFQVPYVLVPKDALGREVRYVADFVYYEKQGGMWWRVVEDVKGFKTDVYRLKRRLMFDKYGIKIRET